MRRNTKLVSGVNLILTAIIFSFRDLHYTLHQRSKTFAFMQDSPNRQTKLFYELVII
jgi:hypothetical protein